MTSAPDEIDGRAIHYKHYEARFYQVFSYIFGRFISTLPQRSIEITAFAIPLYWMVGFDPTASSFFIFLAILICYTSGLKMMFSILAQLLPKKANVQGVGTFVVLLLTLFGGFIVYPSALNRWFYWIYVSNPAAWALQGLLTLEFTSEKYNDAAVSGEVFLELYNFRTGREWIGYTFAYMIPYSILCTFVLGIVLKYVKIEPTRADAKTGKTVAIGDAPTKCTEMNLPFIPVDLTFENIVYEVKASTGNETLRLLNEVSGTFKMGRMCALMGSSGAGEQSEDLLVFRESPFVITGLTHS
jgi:ABC-type multidrug transport system fused ATPase/permease subunit